MNAAWVLVGIMVWVWACWSAVILYLDYRARRRHRDMIDARAWREKVEAMRRIHDQDGAA